MWVDMAPVTVKTREAIRQHAKRIVKQADEHEHLINKITYCMGVLLFGVCCYLLGARPQDIPYAYCFFFLTAVPLRWIYYRSKKWHYFLLDFCYYANVILCIQLIFVPRSDKLFLLCFAFSEGPLAWALIVWRCSLVFSSIDKLVSVMIHLLPGTVLFIIRWWDPSTFTQHGQEDTGPWPAWPQVERGLHVWTYMLIMPLAAYVVWQTAYWILVDVLRRNRLLSDPEVLTSYRELSRRAARANTWFWRVSATFGEQHRVTLFNLLQLIFTVATMSLTVPMFYSYKLHAFFQLFKIAASIWNGGNFFFDVMPRQVQAKAQKKKAAKGEHVHSSASAPHDRAKAGQGSVGEWKAGPVATVVFDKSKEVGNGFVAHECEECEEAKERSLADASEFSSGALQSFMSELKAYPELGSSDSLAGEWGEDEVWEDAGADAEVRMNGNGHVGEGPGRPNGVLGVGNGTEANGLHHHEPPPLSTSPSE